MYVCGCVSILVLVLFFFTVCFCVWVSYFASLVLLLLLGCFGVGGVVVKDFFPVYIITVRESDCARLFMGALQQVAFDDVG